MLIKWAYFFDLVTLVYVVALLTFKGQATLSYGTEYPGKCPG